MNRNNNYRVDILPANAEDKYTVPCGMNTIVALSPRPAIKQTWSIPAGHVAVYSEWHGMPLTGEYKVKRVVHATTK